MSEDFEVTLPKLGESILNATVVQWFKKEGDSIKKDEPLLEVATDKVNSEIPSPVSGVLKKIHARVDQELTVGDSLATIGQQGAIRTREEAPKRVEQETTSTDTSQQGYYSPALLRIARENNISLETLEKISGTGAGGRVTKKDVEDYIAKREKPCPFTSSSSKEEVERIKMSPLRKAIAENMVRSFYEAPHATLITEVDVTDLMKTIQKEKEGFLKKHGVKLTITSFVARAISRSLKEYPFLNASVEKDTILMKKSVNLGIAVSVEQGVMVPVIRSCEKLSLPEIAKQVATFAEKARTQKLIPNDVQEGTITMTNFGMTGIKIGTPIIRFPEVAIIGLGAITKTVVPLTETEFAVRQIMHLSLTFDHRVIDGMYGCDFLNLLKKHLERDLETN